MPIKSNAGSQMPVKRRIMRELKINEISGVDVPAQEGATAVIMKRKHRPEDRKKKKKKKGSGHLDNSQTDEMLAKGAALTTDEEGFAHLVILSGPPDGVEQTSGETTWQDGHNHPWVRTPEGDILIGAGESSDGVSHSHTIAVMSKAEEDEDGTEKRKFTAQERERLADEGKALPDGSFPIVTTADLRNAISAFGRAANKAQVARHIKRRARALGATDLLPEEGRLAGLLKNEASEDDNQNAGSAGEVGNKEINMPDTNKKVEELQAQLARANSVASLNDAEKAHFETLKGADADTFLAKSVDERKTEVTAINKAQAKADIDANPVEYTTMDGIELRKSAGPAFISMAKSNDALRKRVDEGDKKLEKAALEKRAEAELPYLPGNLDTRAAMLKAIDGIEDESQRKAAMNALKAQNESMSKAFSNVGHGNTPAPGSADEELDALAKVYHKDHPELTEEQAYSDVLDTTKGSELYTKTLN